MTIDRQAYDFFRKNAGYIVGENAKGALALARAEQWAQDHLTFDWEPDQDADRGPVDWGWSENDVKRWNRYSHQVEQCVAYMVCNSCHNPLPTQSLCGIWDADDNYRRVIQAELALEAMSGYEQGNY